MWRGDGDKSANGLSNAAAKGETVNECGCTMSSWEKSMFNVLENLCCWTDTLLGRRKWLLWSRGAYGSTARRTRQRVRCVYFNRSTKTVRNKVVSGSDALSRAG